MQESKHPTQSLRALSELDTAMLIGDSIFCMMAFFRSSEYRNINPFLPPLCGHLSNSWEATTILPRGVQADSLLP